METKQTGNTEGTDITALTTDINDDNMTFILNQAGDGVNTFYDLYRKYSSESFNPRCDLTPTHKGYRKRNKYLRETEPNPYNIGRNDTCLCGSKKKV